MTTDPWDDVRQGHYQRALEGFARQLDASPRIRDIVLNNRATAYLGLRDYAAAAQDFAEVLRSGPSTATGHAGLGVCQWCQF